MSSPGPSENENLTSTPTHPGLALIGKGEFVDPEPCLRERLAMFVATVPHGRREREPVRGAPGSSLAGQGRFEEAGP